MAHLISKLSAAAIFTAFVATQVQAALVNVSFTGVVNAGSYDRFGAVYGQGVEGQIGDVISGSFLINTASVVDNNSNPSIGDWSTPTSIFPNPFNNLKGSFTIDGVKTQTSQFMDLTIGHSLEIAALYDFNTSAAPSGQDTLVIQDGSQKLLCANGNPSSCTGGSVGDSILSVRLWGNLSFLQGTSLEQTIDLDSNEIAAIIAAGGGQNNQYYHWQYNQERNNYIYDARGTFNLTSLSFSPVITSSVPEPESLALVLVGLTMMGALARRRKQRVS
jgi:hypothetical protein